MTRRGDEIRVLGASALPTGCYGSATEPKVSAHSGYARLARTPGEAPPPLANAHPAEGTAPPCLASGNGYRRPAAASLLSVLAYGQQWALPRGVLPLAERLVHRFLLSSWLIPPEVCPGAVPPARGVHKNARTAARTSCLRVRVYAFLQSFPVHSSHPRCRRLTGLELSKKR